MLTEIYITTLLLSAITTIMAAVHGVLLQRMEGGNSHTSWNEL